MKTITQLQNQLELAVNQCLQAVSSASMAAATKRCNEIQKQIDQLNLKNKVK